jgi:hypothetical protein
LQQLVVVIPVPASLGRKQCEVGKTRDVTFDDNLPEDEFCPRCGYPLPPSGVCERLELTYLNGWLSSPTVVACQPGSQADFKLRSP